VKEKVEIPEECERCGTSNVKLEEYDGTRCNLRIWLCKFCAVDHRQGENKSIASMFHVLEESILAEMKKLLDEKGD